MCPAQSISLNRVVIQLSTSFRTTQAYWLKWLICCLFLCSLVGLRPRKVWRNSVSSGPPQLLDIYETCKDIRKQYFSASKNSKFNNMGKDSCVAWSCKGGLCYYTWGLNQTFCLKRCPSSSHFAVVPSAGRAALNKCSLSIFVSGPLNPSQALSLPNTGSHRCVKF